MAIHQNANMRGERGAEFVGCVLNTWERNGSWDSDFYATVWDEDAQRVRDIEYDTTRCGGGGSAEIDATEEVLNKAFQYYYNNSREFIERCIESNAKKYGKGDEVRVIRGRKVKVGTVGKCFWRGTCYNRYSRMNEDRMGIEVGGEKFFISADNCERNEWEKYLPTEEDKEKQRRNYAVSCMPYWARERFGGSAARGGGFFAL